MLPLNGVTLNGQSGAVRASTAAETWEYVELFASESGWSEIELIMQWARTPHRFAEMIEAGFPLPAWIAESRREGYEAAWLVFRRHRYTVPTPNANANAKSTAATTVNPEDFTQRAPRGSKPHHSYANPFSPGTNLLFINPGNPAVSWHRFHSINNEQVNHSAESGRTRRFIVAQSARRKNKPISMEEQQALSDRLSLAREAKSHNAQARAGRARELLDQGVAREDIATALGVDPRTIRRYLAAQAENS